MSELEAALVLALAAGADAPATATTATNTEATMRLITVNSPSMREDDSLPPAHSILSRHTRYVNGSASQSTLLTLWPGGDDSSHASRPVSALGLMAI